jgi:uncharacterized protein YbjT (DUF2867 family)
VPVLVVGPEGAVGRHAVRLLQAGGGEVRAFVAADVDPLSDATAAALRARGVKVAHGDLDDESHVERALEQVHTVLHLAGRPTDEPDPWLERAATVVAAAIGAGCRRLVLLSDLSAAGPAGNRWLEALAEAEAMAEAAPLESVVLRAAAVHGADDPLTTALAAGALGSDPPGAHWPVAAVDVATAAVLADRERDLDLDLHVVVPLTGPERRTTADLAAALARLLPGTAPGDPLPPHAVELLHRVVERPDDAVSAGGRALSAGLA